MATHNDLGITGEKLAASYLQGLGHTILATNYRFRRSEIDIIYTEGELTVFCEVKTRTGKAYGLPEESITDRKVELFQQAAEEYMQHHKPGSEIRFDILSITINGSKHDVFHIRDAFY